MSAATDRPESVTLRQHPDIFYWWPIWLLAFVLAGLGTWRGHHLVVAPPGATIETDASGTVAVTPPPATEDAPRPTVKVVGGVPRTGSVIFLVTLVLVVFLTAVQLGKVGEVILMTLLGLGVVGLLLATIYRPDFFESLEVLRELPVYLSVGTYLFLGCTLFPLWVLSVLVFPHDTLTFTGTHLVLQKDFGEIVQPYTPGAVRVSVSSGGMKEYILGMGSGTVVVTLTGPEPKTFEFHGVLFVGAKMAQVQRLIGQA